MRVWLFLLIALGWAQDPSAAVELFRMGRYAEAYPAFKRLFERSQDYLWGSFAVECLLQEGRTSEYQRWLQNERTRNRLSIWGSAWELRKRALEGDTNALKGWSALVERPEVPLPTLEALAEVAYRVWGQLEWQRRALLAARRQNPLPHAYAELLRFSYELEGRWAEAWQETLLAWDPQSQSVDSVLAILSRYLAAGLPADTAELSLLQRWQAQTHPALAQLLERFYLLMEDFTEALRYAKVLFRYKPDCQPLYEVGWTAYEKGLFSPALEAFRQILQVGESCPYYATVLQRYLEAEALLNKPEQALRLLDSLERRQPESPALLLERARWLLRLGRAEEVIAHLEPFTPNLPSLAAQRYLLLAEAALQKGDFLQARLYLLELESRFPESSWVSEAYFQLARLAYFQGEFELAKTRLRLLKNNTQDDLSNDAIQLFWQIEDNLKPDTLTEPLRLFALAELYRLQNRPEAAFRLLDSLQNTYKGHPITDDVLWQKAYYFLQRGDTTQARTYLLALADYPDSESLYRDDALYLLAQLARSPAEAARWYERLLRELPGSLYARLARERLQELAR